jgi:hypothetical protein
MLYWRFLMRKGDRIFVDGMSSVKMTNGVILMEFFNNNKTNNAQEDCGEIVMSQQAFLRAYNAMDDLLKQMIAAGIVRRNDDAAPAGGEGAVRPAAVSPNFD